MIPLTRTDDSRMSHPRDSRFLAVSFLAVLLAVAACAPGGEPEGGDDGVVRTALHDFRVEEVADGLVRPFSLAFTPEGDLLVTERPGRLRIVRDGVLLPDSVEGLPPIRALGRGARSMAGFEQAGLRDAILHPDFATNRLLYLSYVKPGPDSLGTIAIARGRFENDRLSDVEELFHADAPGNGTERSSMWGGRLVFDHDGYLFMTLGDRQWPPAGELGAHPAQNLSNHNGSTIRSTTMAGSRRTTRSSDAPATRRSTPRSGRGATATRRGWRSIRRRESCGRTSTARRAETS